MNRLLLVAMLIVAACTGAAPNTAARSQQANSATAADRRRGASLYARHCALCHGDLGSANGPASPLLLPPARDFTLARFRLVSTQNGVPTDADLIAVLKRGMPGSAMPAWSTFADHDLACLAAYVRHLSIEMMTMAIESDQGFADGEMLAAGEARAIATRKMTPGEPIAMPAAAACDRATLDLGKHRYQRHCAPCHGADGKGRNREPQWNENGDLNWARDFTSGILKGGASKEQLYRRIVAGMPGSAMGPTQLADGDAAALVAYLQTLIPAGSEARLVTGRALIRAVRVDGAVPAEVGDARWAAATPVTVVLSPLSWHDASVTAATISALHDDTDLAVRVHWQDATRNERLFGESRFSDGVAVQFSADDQPPLFGMGAHGHPVNIWHWRSFRLEDLTGVLDLETPHSLRDPDRDQAALGDATVAIDASSATRPSASGDSVTAEGFQSAARFADGALALRVVPSWQDGAWDVIFIRPMKPRVAREMSLVPGMRVQISCAVWNGAALDRGGHKSIGIWQELLIE